MTKRSLLSMTWILLLAMLAAPAAADDPQQTADANETQEAKDDQAKDAEKEKTGDAAVSATTSESSGGSSSGSSSSSSSSSAPKHAAILKDAKTITGMLPVYQKGNKLYGEFNSGHYGSEFIVLISIARGIGQGSILGGYSWGFGDDWVWKFRKVDDDLHVIRRNVRFKANKGSPEASALHNAYTDSVLYSLPIMTKGPKGGDLVDLTPIFMSDLPQIGRTLPGFSFSSNKSTWAKVKGFPDNLQLQVAATYSSSGRFNLDTVADSRGATINVHYSISKLPSTGYTSRMADDRVGYFVTAVKDYSKNSDRDRFYRYINRWNLQKPSGVGEAPYPPKKPIIFWIEKTVPFQYRSVVRDGIEEWNKAFLKAGWVDAIEVRQQPDNADWDPEDINYNTFRWITSSAGFAMGPSRVNPYTGEILDADIIFDADFLQYWKEEFETLTPETVAAISGGPVNRPAEETTPGEVLLYGPNPSNCVLSHGMARQFAFGATALMAKVDPKVLEEQQEKLIVQGLKEVVMHEVGHTLGLRHNFKASRLMDLKELNDPEKSAGKAIVASVMDYNPTNIVPKGWKQGDYYTTTIGPYDYWAIDYGYKPLSGGTTGEVKELQKIAARSGEEGLAFATDEDTPTYEPDPDVNTWDLGDDAVEYAKMRADLVREIMPGLVERTTKEGDDYTQVRRAFNILLSMHGQGMSYVARYVGGLHVSRSHKGDKDAPPPFETIDPKKQREALKILQEQVFSDKPFDFPPELYNHLAGSKWTHWGADRPMRTDLAVHDVISVWQERILSQLMSSTNLERIHDIELRVPADEDAFTTAELIEKLTKAVFAEVDSVKEDGDYTNRKPAISSLRRNLQRVYLRRLSNLAMGRAFAPDDCQTVAYAELASLEPQIEKLLKSNARLDSYSRAHLQETSRRIRKVLDAELTLSSP